MTARAHRVSRLPIALRSSLTVLPSISASRASGSSSRSAVHAFICSHSARILRPEFSTERRPSSSSLATAALIFWLSDVCAARHSSRSSIWSTTNCWTSFVSVSSRPPTTTSAPSTCAVTEKIWSSSLLAYSSMRLLRTPAVLSSLLSRRQSPLSIVAVPCRRCSTRSASTPTSSSIRPLSSWCVCSTLRLVYPSSESSRV